MSTKPVQQHAQGEAPESVHPSAAPVPSGLAPGAQDNFPLDADLQRRFGGLERLYGVEGAARIRTAHVAVIGVGGVGSWAVEALARSGVGRLTLIDLDNVAESNVNRQIHALSTTVGQAKVDAMRDRIALINPKCQVVCIEEFVEPGNWPAIRSPPPLLVRCAALFDADRRGRGDLGGDRRQGRLVAVRCEGRRDPADGCGAYLI